MSHHDFRITPACHLYLDFILQQCNVLWASELFAWINISALISQST
jgi:hypothetical protein